MDGRAVTQADECVRRYTKSAQVEDGVADDLAGAVEGDVAAAIAFEEFNAALGENVREMRLRWRLSHCGLA